MDTYNEIYITGIHSYCKSIFLLDLMYFLKYMIPTTNFVILKIFYTYNDAYSIYMLVLRKHLHFSLLDGALIPTVTL